MMTFSCKHRRQSSGNSSSGSSRPSKGLGLVSQSLSSLRCSIGFFEACCEPPWTGPSSHQTPAHRFIARLLQTSATIFSKMLLTGLLTCCGGCCCCCRGAAAADAAAHAAAAAADAAASAAHASALLLFLFFFLLRLDLHLLVLLVLLLLVLLFSFLFLFCLLGFVLVDRFLDALCMLRPSKGRDAPPSAFGFFEAYIMPSSPTLCILRGDQCDLAETQLQLDIVPRLAVQNRPTHSF